MFSTGLVLAEATSAAASMMGTRAEWTALGLVGGFLAVVWLLFLYQTQAGIISRATAKEAIRQPVFLLLMALSAFLLVLNTFLPFFSLGEDVKMLKDCGLATILISGLLLAVWIASTSIADEIEGKTAMTLLSKPINRRQFVVGKYVGILTSTLLLILPLTLLFVVLIFYKTAYDARESSITVTTQDQLAQAVQVIPGVILSFLEVAVLAAISVAISTRLPMVVNMSACLAIFVVGHLTPMLVGSSTGRLELVMFFARLIATVLPSLEVFNVSASVATGSHVPGVYLLWTAVYSIAYCTMAILLAFFLFEDRDLA